MVEVRLKRSRNRPIINGEYAYYLRRGDGKHPSVVNRGHSHDRPTFRKAAWVLTMSGAYIVPGFWRTYYGGWAGRNTAFKPDDPEALPAIKDLQIHHAFFTQLEDASLREWWKLVPQEKILSSVPNVSDGSTGQSYCLADPGHSYIVYTENTTSTVLDLSAAPNVTFRASQFDPRAGHRMLLDAAVKGGTTYTLASPDTEDWVFELNQN
jgi:hypothetical protein